MMVSSMRCGVEEVERTELLEILILGLLAVGLGIAMLNIQGRSFCVEKTQERSAQKDRPRVFIPGDFREFLRITQMPLHI